ncbi:MAG: DMT family transporter, partial [Solirubrobacteraceae bacterium]
MTVLSLRFDPSERPTRVRAAGLVLGFVGVVAMFGIDVSGNLAELLGALALLGAACGYAGGPMLVKHGMGGIDARVAMGASLALASVILLPLAIIDTPPRMPSAGALAAVAALGVV